MFYEKFGLLKEIFMKQCYQTKYFLNRQSVKENKLPFPGTPEPGVGTDL